MIGINHFKEEKGEKMKSNIDVYKLAGKIVDNYSYEELYESAFIGTLDFLKTLDKNELVEQASLIGFYEE